MPEPLPERTRRVALLGGSFNPPHVCHLLLSIYLLETMPLDAVCWLPVFRHAFAKDAGLAPFSDRLAMAEAAAAGDPRIEVNAIESRLPSPSYTVDTLAALEREHGDTAFSFVIGGDLLPELPLWHRWEELRERLEFVVVGRGEPIDPAALPPGGRFHVRDFHLPRLSSSSLRDALRRGEDVSASVPAAVLRYLRAHPELYG